MLVYFLCLFLIPMWGVIGLLIKDINKRRKIISFVIFIQLLIMMILRSPKMTYDTPVYLEIFKQVHSISVFDFKNLTNTTTLEIGFSYLNKIISFISLEDQFYILVMSFLTLFLIKKLIDKHSKIVWLSYYLFYSLYFYLSFFSMIRQGLAMALIAVSFIYLFESKKGKFVLTVLVAFLIHKTAIIFLPLIFLSSKKVNSKFYLILLLLSISTWVFSEKILNFLFKYGGYQNYSYKAVEGEGLNLLIVYVLIFIATLYFKTPLLKENTKNSIYFYIIAFSIVSQILALEFSLFSRTSLYFGLFNILLIPNIISGIEDKGMKWFGMIILITLTPIYMYINLNKNLGGVIPYTLFWN